MTDKPLVSAVIPVYNGGLYLAQAIESVLAQTYTPIEIIVIDDGSVDNSPDIARSFAGIRYYRQPNQGVAAARNAGIRCSNGEFIAFLDQDDIWTPDKVYVQMEYLFGNPATDGVFSRQRHFLEPGVEKPGWLKRDLLLREQAGFFPSALLVRKGVFAKIGCFDAGYKHSSDVDWIARSKEAGIILQILPEVLLHRRIHGANASGETDVIHHELLTTLQRSIKRRHIQKSICAGVREREADGK